MVEGTETTRGFIPYKQHPKYPWLWIPVKVAKARRSDQAKGLRPPQTIDGDYVYALPGGGDYVG